MKERDKSRCPRILGLFQKRIDGDDALLELARFRFREFGLRAEFYAESPSELEWLMGFRPSPEIPGVVHLGRDLNIFRDADRQHVLEFARRFKGRIFGMVVHDQIEIIDRHEEYLDCLRKIESGLDEIGG